MQFTPKFNELKTSNVFDFESMEKKLIESDFFVEKKKSINEGGKYGTIKKYGSLELSLNDSDLKTIIKSEK